MLGAEIGLITAALGLLGSAVLTVDSSIRLLEAAKKNVWGNLGTPTHIAMRKTLWGAPLSLEGLTGGAKRSADLIVIAHATCEGALDTGVVKTASAVTASHTLLLVAFASSPDCAELKAMTATHEVARVSADQLTGGLEVTVVALKRKPPPIQDKEPDDEALPDVLPDGGGHEPPPGGARAGAGA